FAAGMLSLPQIVIDLAAQPAFSAGAAAVRLAQPDLQTPGQVNRNGCMTMQYARQGHTAYAQLSRRFRHRQTERRKNVFTQGLDSVGQGVLAHAELVVMVRVVHQVGVLPSKDRGRARLSIDPYRPQPLQVYAAQRMQTP